MLRAILYRTSPGDSTPQSSSYTVTYQPSQKLSKLDEPDMRDTAGEVGMSSYSNSVSIWDVALRTCQKQWTIWRGGERGSRISVLIVQLDNVDDDVCACMCVCV